MKLSPRRLIAAAVLAALGLPVLAQSTPAPTEAPTAAAPAATASTPKTSEPKASATKKTKTAKKQAHAWQYDHPHRDHHPETKNQHHGHTHASHHNEEGENSLQAQQPEPAPNGHAHQQSHANHMAEHHAALKATLQLAPEQEAAWSTFTQAMSTPKTHARLDNQSLEHLTTPERIDRMRAVRAQRLAESDQRSDAIKAFYAALNPAQQKTFDAHTQQHFGAHSGMHGEHAKNHHHAGGGHHPAAAHPGKHHARPQHHRGHHGQRSDKAETPAAQ